MSEPLAWLDGALAGLDEAGLRRKLRHHEGAAAAWLDLDGRRLLHLSGNNYLGLADDPRLVEAAAVAAQRHGTGSGASRLVTGGTTEHRALERELADWKGTEDAVVLSSGYLANLAVVTALVGKGDTVVSDELNHASIIDACRLSGAEVRVHRHGDAAHADALLADAPGRRLLITDGVFSMDGDLAPLPQLCDAAERHGAMVVVDDAHGSGVIGPDGRGTTAALRCEGRVHAIVVTLSKALGAAGGAIACSSQLAEWIRNRARPFIFDTAPPAPTVAAARRAIQIVRAEPELGTQAITRNGMLAAGLRRLGHTVPYVDACILPLIVGSNDAAMTAMQHLLDRDVLAVAIRPPSVAPGTARLRVTTMATHTDDDLDLAVTSIDEALRAAAAI